MIYKLKYKIKYAFQRMFRGYDNRALWNYFDWFSEISSDILSKMAENHCGHPGDMTDEEWTATLNKISFLLKESTEDKTSMKNAYEEDFMNLLLKVNNTNSKNFVSAQSVDKDLSDKYYEREDEIFEYRNKCKDEALDLIKEYYWNLWD